MMFLSNPTAVAHYDSPDYQGQPAIRMGSVECVMSHSVPGVVSLVREILRVTDHTYKNTLIDIGWWADMKARQAPKLLGWHTDFTVGDLSKPGLRHETHYIFHTGSARSCTRFLKEDISIEDAKLQTSPPSYISTSQNVLYKYGRAHLHTATRAECDGDRLLIRVSLSDYLRPVNKVFETTSYKIPLWVPFVWGSNASHQGV